MSSANPAIDLGITDSGRGAPAFVVGGAALALGSLGVVATSVLYALSPPAAALPAYPLDQALAGARRRDDVVRRRHGRDFLRHRHGRWNASGCV